MPAPPIGMRLGILAELDKIAGSTNNGYYCEFIPAATVSMINTQTYSYGNMSFNGVYPTASYTAGGKTAPTGTGNVNSLGWGDIYPGTWHDDYHTARFPSGSDSSLNDSGSGFIPGASTMNSHRGWYMRLPSTNPTGTYTSYKTFLMGGINSSSDAGWVRYGTHGWTDVNRKGSVGSYHEGTDGSTSSTIVGTAVSVDFTDDKISGSDAGPNQVVGADEGGTGAASNIIDDQDHWRYITTYSALRPEPTVIGMTNNPYTGKKWQRDDFYGNFQVGYGNGNNSTLANVPSQTFHMTPRLNTDSMFVPFSQTIPEVLSGSAMTDPWSGSRGGYIQQNGWVSHSFGQSGKCVDGGSTGAGGYPATNLQYTRQIPSTGADSGTQPGFPAEDGDSAPSGWIFSGSGDNMPADNTYTAAEETNGTITGNLGYDVGLRNRPRLDGIPLDAEIQYAAIYTETSTNVGGFKNRSIGSRWGAVACYVLFTSDTGVAGPNK